MDFKNEKFKRLFEAAMDCLQDAERMREGKLVLQSIALIGQKVYNEGPAIADHLQVKDMRTRAVPSVRSGRSQLAQPGTTPKGCDDCPGNAVEEAMQAVSAGIDPNSNKENPSGFQTEAEAIIDTKSETPTPPVFPADTRTELPDAPENCKSIAELKSYYAFDSPRPKSDIAAAIKSDLDRLNVEYNGRLRSASSLVEEFYNVVINEG